MILINRKETKAIVKEYPNYDWMIKQRENEIMHPYNEDRDENVGGGKMKFGKNEGVANKAIKIAYDPFIKECKKRQKAIDIAFKQTDSETVKIVTELAFKRYPKTQLALALELKIGRTTVFRKYNAFIDDVRRIYSKLDEIEQI